MEFRFETSGANTFLVYELSSADSVDQVGLKMMVSNPIEGLAPVIFTQFDEKRYLKYNISAKVALADFLVGPVRKKQLLDSFSNILAAVIEAGEYMIGADSLLLDTQRIYINVSSCEVAVVALPLSGYVSGTDVGAFFKSIMFGTKFDQTENNDHIGKIVNFLNSNPAFSPDEFKMLVDSLGAKPPVRDLRPTPPAATAPPVQQQAHAYAQGPMPVPHAPAMPPIAAPPPASAAPLQAAAHLAPGEKEMTLVYLMAHYSKENKAIYDAQQARKKSGAPAPAASHAPAPPPSAVAPALAPGEKEMTLVYLMAHYSKENKAIYDAQQAQKKSAGNTPKASAPASAQAVRFAVPGAASAPVAPPLPVQPQPVQPQPAPQAPPVQPPPPAPPRPAPPAPPPGIQPGRIDAPRQPAPSHFGETTMLGAAPSGTTILGADEPAPQRAAAHMVRVKTGERIPVGGETFRIGKEKTYADYCIDGNGAISRSHAMIRLRDGDYFISDTNSTNHTYVDGMMLPSNLETKLAHGAKLRFADEEFVFNLY